MNERKFLIELANPLASAPIQYAIARSVFRNASLITAPIAWSCRSKHGSPDQSQPSKCQCRMNHAAEPPPSPAEDPISNISPPVASPPLQVESPHSLATDLTGTNLAAGSVGIYDSVRSGCKDFRHSSPIYSWLNSITRSTLMARSIGLACFARIFVTGAIVAFGDHKD